ncbi:MAG TPA: hypothetical protein VJT75_04290 [Thermoleophilaceae bacterium]|nr:hypothetical protein [Thermoleophilaceae bacterium]
MKPERLLIPLAAIAVAIFATSRLMVAIDPGEAHPTGLGGDTAKSAEKAIRKATGGGDGNGDGGGKGGSRESHSFFSRAGMRDLQRLVTEEAGPEARVSLFRIQASQAQVFTRSGSGGKMLVLERGPKVKFSASTPAGIPGGFGIRSVDTSAPSRILVAIARLSDASANDVDYMVYLVSPIDRTGRWDAFLKRGATHFAADAHGRHVTQP